MIHVTPIQRTNRNYNVAFRKRIRLIVKTRVYLCLLLVCGPRLQTPDLYATRCGETLHSIPPSIAFPYSSTRPFARNIWDAAAGCTVAWQRSGALEALPRCHDNRCRWTNREAELSS
jgi:hypothetical protein